MPHSMQRRSPGNNYRNPGFYHITINVYDRKKQSLGRITGDAQYPDGHPNGPKVELTAIGKMVEYELRHSITQHYPVIEIQDYVVMPEHLHFIVNVKNSLISKNGRQVHLGQVMAGFKAGCNRHYWEMTGQQEVVAKPQPTTSPSAAGPLADGVAGGSAAGPLADGVAGGSAAGAPASGTNKKLRFSSGRNPLFASGYVDVIPLMPGQLETQRAYIHANPRNRLLRMNNPTTLKPQRKSIDTLVTPNALRGYLIREHALHQENTQMWQAIAGRLLTDNNHIVCDSYGNLQLSDNQLLPVVCHRKDKTSFAQQKQACLKAASNNAVLVSPRIAKGEQEIIDEAMAQGHPVILIADNGFPEIYHPSEARLQQCVANRLLLLTPWVYCYSPANEDITVAWCKAMNCFAQALCRTKDDWWKNTIDDCRSITPGGR